MRRLVSLWLAPFAAFCLTRVVASSLLFGRIDQGHGTLVGETGAAAGEAS